MPHDFWDERVNIRRMPSEKCAPEAPIEVTGLALEVLPRPVFGEVIDTSAMGIKGSVESCAR
jgi:hypothetical protein